MVQEHKVTKATVYKLLRRYWQRGQTPNALIPDYKNSGAPGKDVQRQEQQRLAEPENMVRVKEPR